MRIQKVLKTGGCMNRVVTGGAASHAGAMTGTKVRRIQSIMLVLIALIGVVASSGAVADWALNMRQGVTDVSQDIYNLHTIVAWVCVFIGIGVFGVMIYSMIYHTKAKGHQPATFHENTKVELAWTIIPLIVLILIAIPATATLIRIENSDHAEMNIKVTGFQWKWQYEYIEDKVSFFSSLAQSSRDGVTDELKRDSLEHYLLEVDNRLVVPVDTNIRFLVTSNDVIHSWWVPDFGVKQDANPGFINDTWTNIPKPGIYRGQCAELCGKDHGFMPIVVEAVSKEDYRAWVADQQAAAQAASAGADKQWSKDDLIAEGKEVYARACGGCHGPTGAGIPGVFPAITGSPIATGDVDAHIDIVMHGKTGTAMQAFAAQLNDVEMASVITFERNALGNATGDLVQPSTIKAKR